MLEIVKNTSISCHFFSRWTNQRDPDSVVSKFTLYSL